MNLKIELQLREHRLDAARYNEFSSMVPALIGVILGLLLRALILWLRKRKRMSSPPLDNRGPLPQPQPWKPPGPGSCASTERPAGKPVLRGLAGHYAGSSVELTTGPLTFGRDARASNMVMPPDATSVSQRHCTLSWDGSRFFIEDCWSTNGTFLASGEKLEPGRKRPLAPGEQFFLGDGQNAFEVAFE